MGRAKQVPDEPVNRERRFSGTEGTRRVMAS
jgi:hypothetical protein